MQIFGSRQCHGPAVFGKLQLDSHPCVQIASASLVGQLGLHGSGIVCESKNVRSQLVGTE